MHHSPGITRRSEDTLQSATAPPSGFTFEAHPLRDQLLAEVHARPFRAVATPSHFFHFAFANPQSGSASHASLNAFCTRHASPPPAADARHLYLDLGAVALRWELHAEFTTYTWEFKGSGCHDKARAWMAELQPSGSHLVSVHVELSRCAGEDELEKGFEASSLAMSCVEGGAALVASDFRPNEHGFVTVRIFDRGLSGIGAGALVQRLLELETYRILALLGLFEAQRVAPMVSRIERSLSQLMSGISRDNSHAGNEAALNELVNLSAALEADGIASQYRFAASKAYYEIVQGRITAIGEKACGQRSTFGGFMSRRLDPAMRTCMTMERRQVELGSKLARTAELLRTRVNCEIERQSRDLLLSMNDRTRSQFRLQRTIERFSIVAISYYLVALLSYAFKGLGKFDEGYDADLETALAVPVVVATVWILLTVLNRRNSGAERDPVD